ncbi:MAG: hypothetical protein IJJ26_09640 [Victivallales bacterium]|nr:hypothetical protein [Victivallales bacterium]
MIENLEENEKTLLRLQALELLTREGEVLCWAELHPRQMERILKEYQELLKKLPTSWRERFQRLATNKKQMPMVPEQRCVCQNCRMTISLPLMKRMRAKQLEPICPNCGHFLKLDPAQLPPKY